MFLPLLLSLPVARLFGIGTGFLLISSLFCPAVLPISKELVRLKMERPAACPRIEDMLILCVSSGGAAIGGALMSRKPLQDDCRRRDPGSDVFMFSSRSSSFVVMTSSALVEKETLFDDEDRGGEDVEASRECGREM